MQRFRTLAAMEDEYGFIKRGIMPGSYAVENGWKYILTAGGRDCDCGKGMLCPLNTQEKV